MISSKLPDIQGSRELIQLTALAYSEYVQAKHFFFDTGLFDSEEVCKLVSSIERQCSTFGSAVIPQQSGIPRLVTPDDAHHIVILALKTYHEAASKFLSAEEKSKRAVDEALKTKDDLNDESL